MKKNEKNNLNVGKDMSMLVFDPCIMVMLPLAYNAEEEAFIISLLTNCKLISTPRTLTVNTKVTSWWKRRAKNDSSSLPSTMFEDNVGEDELSAHSSYTIDINDSNYIDNLGPHPTMLITKYL
jgi:hypothetical protein